MAVMKSYHLSADWFLVNDVSGWQCTVKWHTACSLCRRGAVTNYKIIHYQLLPVSLSLATLT